ncbi:MAG: NADH-quinone oxidoreductase subunit L, partial [Desulfobacterales bacterium]
MTDFHLLAALLAALAPLGAFGLIMVLLRARPRIAAGVAIGAVALSFGAALVLLVSLRQLTVPLVYTLRWAAAGSLVIPVGVLLDPLSLLMLAIV